MKRWKGLKDLVIDAVEWTASLVQEQHESVTDKTFAQLKRIEPIAAPVEVVETAQKLGTRSVYATIRGINAAVGAMLDVGEQLAAAAGAELPDGDDSVPVRSTAAGSLAWVRESAIAALNGAIGDYLAASGNALDVGMSLRKDGSKVELSPEGVAAAFPDASPKICVFVHGLMCNEWSWSLYARDVHGDSSTNYGTLLQRDLGYTPVYVRYNTGRRIPENGRDLAELLESLVRVHPVPLEEIVLVGHSMGGLVSRSACAYAAEAGHGWVDRAKHVFSLGAPHLGAPLEKASHLVATALSFVEHPATQVPARLINGRSAGIKDLRDGSIRDDDWLGKDPRALIEETRREVAFVPDVAYYFVAGTITLDPEHPVGQLVGDLLVLAPSASGDHPDLAHRVPLGERRHVVLGGVSHMRLLNHPAIYEHLRAWCGGH